jgi:hypothetical protein
VPFSSSFFIEANTALPTSGTPPCRMIRNPSSFTILSYFHMGGIDNLLFFLLIKASTWLTPPPGALRNPPTVFTVFLCFLCPIYDATIKVMGITEGWYLAWLIVQ